MLRRLQKIICMMMIAVLLVPAAAPAFAASVTARVSSSSARVYKSASKSSDSVSLKKGTQLKVTAVSGSWAKVKLNGNTGYMPKKYLSVADSGSAAKSNSSKKVTGYASKNTYVYKSASSSSARKAVSVNTKVYVVGKTGSYYKVQNSSGVTGYMKTSCVSRNKVSAKSSKSGSSKKNSWKSKVVKMNWYNGGSHVLEKGHYGYIYDIDTGISLKIKRMGGHNHADVEPASAADTAKLLRIAGGDFSWKSHAVILKAGGRYVASAINTEPHGDQTIHNNGYDGQFCLHMTGSKTHASDKQNSAHQSSINRAYKWAHK